jgi:glc operon protein GlcG
MQQKWILGESEIDAMLAAARAKADVNMWPVCIAIADDGGHLLAFLRLNDAPLMSINIAIEKAQTAALCRQSTKVFEDLVNHGRQSFLSSSLHSMIEGGIPIYKDGRIIGAVAASGVKSEEDAAIAQAAIDAIA